MSLCSCSLSSHRALFVKNFSVYLLNLDSVVVSVENTNFVEFCVLNCPYFYGRISQGQLTGEVEYADDGSRVSFSTVEWLNAGFGLADKSNAWAGPDHWKYRNPRGKRPFSRLNLRSSLASTISG